MSMQSDKRFDVRVTTAPATTPAGEPFATALARAFGIDAATAQKLAASAPCFVKRGVAIDVAEGLRRTLGNLGAGVEVLEAAAKGASTSAPASASASASTSAPAP